MRCALAFMTVAALLLAGCNGEDRPPQVTAGPTAASTFPPVTGGGACPPGATGSVSGTGGAPTGGAPTGSVSGAGPAPGACDVAPGVVKSKPLDAEQVDVDLSEWAIRPKVAEIAAGKLYFLARNLGPEDPHELVIIRSDLAPDALPVEGGIVPENKVEIIGEIEPFAPGSSASNVFHLEKGSYIFICNIRELVGFAYKSHYREGMRVAFKVT